MRRILCIVAMVFFVGWSARAADPAADGARRRLEALHTIVDEVKSPRVDATSDDRSNRGERINQALVALTGQAVNPLLGVTVLGIYNYIRADESQRSLLPLYDRPVIWLPLLVLMLLMLFNSTLCEAIPPLKLPLNAVGEIVNTAGAAAVLPLVVKMFADAVAAPATEYVAWAANTLLPTAHAFDSAVAVPFSTFGWLAGAAVGLVLYMAIWMTFNVVDVLILLCPFPGIDAVLKSVRLSVIGLLAGFSQLSPLVATLLAVVVAAGSLLAAGWSFRLVFFGLVAATDILGRRVGRPGDIAAFSTDGLARAYRIPMRTYGRVQRTADGQLLFSYRPWLVLGRRVVCLGPVTAFSLGVGLVTDSLAPTAELDAPWLRLPPRFHGQEHLIRQRLGVQGPVPGGLPGSLRSWFRSQFGSAAVR